MVTNAPQNILEFKIKAKKLLKEIKSGDQRISAKAAKRFESIKRFKGKTQVEILKNIKIIRLKDALAVIAEEYGHRSWTLLKKKLEYREKKKNPDNSFLYPPRCRGFFNNWYRNYSEAKSKLEEYGGFLLSYGEDFFIADKNYIEALGLDPNDSDWEKIGWNWVEPKEPIARERLRQKLVKHK